MENHTHEFVSDIIEKLEILYEDENVVVLNKPAGLIAHQSQHTRACTLADWVHIRFPEMSKVGEPIRLQSGEMLSKPGMVHRLDTETSGVLILARNSFSYQFLKTQFQERVVKKTYNAFVYGSLKKNEGLIDRPIGRSSSDFRLFSATRGARGTLREAQTYWRVLERTHEYSYLEIQPKTGRTHQIRVHLKAINHPIVCDKRYAPKKVCALGFSRLALHARSISIILPSGEKRLFEAPLPPDFEHALKIISGKIC